MSVPRLKLRRVAGVCPQTPVVQGKDRHSPRGFADEIPATHRVGEHSAKGMMVALLADMELSGWFLAFLVALLATGLFVTATRARRKESESKRRTRLGLMAVLCGPFVGAALAWLFNTTGDVNPIDFSYYYIVFTIIGGIAGLLAGLAFWMSILLCTRDPSGKGAPDGREADTDELLTR